MGQSGAYELVAVSTKLRNINISVGKKCDTGFLFPYVTIKRGKTQTFLKEKKKKKKKENGRTHV